MKTPFYKIFLSIIIFIFLYHSNLFSGIVSGTLVSTPNGFVPVQNLYAGNTVIGYCCKCKKLIESPITKIKRKKGKRLVLIKLKNENLLVSKEQIFFDPVKRKWVRARNLTCKNYLMSYNFIDDNVVLSKVRCCSTKKVKRKSVIYEISLEYPHTLFISKSQVLTHNLACSLGLGLAFGSGMISFETIAVTASFLGLSLYSLFGRKSKFKTHIVYDPCNQNHSPNKKPDDDKEKKERKINTTTKTEVYDYLKENFGYENYKDGTLKRKPGHEGLGKNAEFLDWDATHNDLEAYRTPKKHKGSIEPGSWKFYKPPVPGRKLFGGK